MAENKVKFGLKNMHYAVLNDGTYGTPVAVPGAVNLSLDPQGDSSTFYADDIAYYVSSSFSGYSGDLELARIPDQMREDLWGDTKNTDGVLVESVGTEPATFALLGQIDGDKNNRLFVFYNCTASRPSFGSSTIAESKEPVTETCTITVTPRASDNKVKAVTTDTTAEATLSGWFTSVYDK